MFTKIAFGLVIVLLLLLETTLISYPFVFILIFLLFMRYQTVSTLVFVLFTGIILDSLRVIPVGTTSLFSFGLFFALFLYNRSIALKDLVLLFVAGYFATFVYGYIAQYPINPVLHTLVFASLFVVAYTVHKKTYGKAHATFDLFR